MTTARKTAHTVINTTRVYGQHSFSSVNIFTAISGTAGTMHSVAIACMWMGVRAVTTAVVSQTTRHESAAEGCCGI